LHILKYIDYFKSFQKICHGSNTSADDSSQLKNAQQPEQQMLAS